jgi:hypothetical protein
MTKFSGAFPKRLWGEKFFINACSGLPTHIPAHNYLKMFEFANKNFLKINSPYYTVLPTNLARMEIDAVHLQPLSMLQKYTVPLLYTVLPTDLARMEIDAVHFKPLDMLQKCTVPPSTQCCQTNLARIERCRTSPASWNAPEIYGATLYTVLTD